MREVAQSVADPAAEYRERLRQRRAAHEALSARDARLSYLRLGVFGVFLLLAFLGWRGTLSYSWLAAPVVVFGWLVQRHDTIIRKRDFAARAILFYERGVSPSSRIGGPGPAKPASDFVDDHHLYANDLDLFGRGSLFELLSIARTRAGEETLAAWLTRPAAPPEVRGPTRGGHRAHTRPRSARARWRWPAPTCARASTARRSSPGPRRPRYCATSGRAGWQRRSACGAVATAAWWGSTGDRRPVRRSSSSLEIAFSTPFRGPAWTRRCTPPTAPPATSTSSRTSCCSSSAQQLRRAAPPRAAATASNTRGARGRRGRFTGCTGSSSCTTGSTTRSSRCIGAALLWGTHLAFAIEHWRRLHGAPRRHLAARGRRVRGAQLAVGLSLRAPRRSVPGDRRRPAPAPFDGSDLGHPLLPAARMVRNDVHLDAADPPARRQRLEHVGQEHAAADRRHQRGARACRRAGPRDARCASRRSSSARRCASRTRCRKDARASTPRSRGSARSPTSRRDRRRCSSCSTSSFTAPTRTTGWSAPSGVLRSLLDRGAIGLITTHDLALTAVADELAPRAANVHFEDHFEGGEIALRLPHEARARDAQQRARADARGRARRRPGREP